MGNIENLKRIQEKANKYNSILETEGFKEFIKDIEDQKRTCEKFILGDQENNKSGCGSFEEYKYWLGRYHAYFEVLLMPRIVLECAIKLGKQT